MADVIETIIFDDSKALPALNNITNALKETDKAMTSLNEETKKVSDSIGKDVIDTNKQIADSTKKTSQEYTNSLKKNIFIFPLDRKRKKVRQIDKNPVLTTLASSLLVTNCISYLTGELVNSGPSLLNVVCDLDAIGPTIIFRKLQPNPQCGCRWEAA